MIDRRTYGPAMGLLFLAAVSIPLVLLGLAAGYLLWG
jgi:hypothetical protein